MDLNETMRESLSAMMDGEASELELRQLVRASEDEAVREAWSRMHLARNLMRSDSTVIAPAGLGDSILAALDQEALPARSWGARLGPLGGLAVAATVAAVTVFGVRGVDLLNGVESQGEAVTVQTVADAEPAGTVYQPGLFRGERDRAAYAQAAPLTGVDVTDTAEISPGLVAAQQRLQEHMLRHAEFSSLNSGRGMMPFARVASYREE